MSPIESATAALLQARRTFARRPVPALPDAASAYAVQAAVAQELGWFAGTAPRHWKSGGPSRAAVLAQLAHEQAVEMIPQRGAYVAKPTIEQAMDVFEARRLIEPAVLRRLIEKLTPERVARLRQHEALEQDARRRNDRRAIVRLSGEFHTLLAQLAANSALERQMRELSTPTCLIIFLYDAGASLDDRAPGPHRRQPDPGAGHGRGRPGGDLRHLSVAQDRS
jgi:hypothetical protein